MSELENEKKGSAQQPMGEETKEKAEHPSTPALEEEVNEADTSEAKEDPAQTAKEDLTAEALIAEHENQPSDEELEAEDTHDDAVSADEEEDEHVYEDHVLELPDYSTYRTEDLVNEAEKLLKNEPVQKLKEHFDSIRKHVIKDLNEERQAKLEAFLEGGGNQIDFEYVQPLRERFRSIYGSYRSQRKKHYDELSAQLAHNFEVKQSLIEKIKELVTKDESIGETFKEFNEIQQQWRNTGPVPRAESGDLWRTYHHHVENFYEYIKINKELRDLDFKKNHEVKERLITEAEELLEMDDMREAFKRLQSLHKKWKHVGPVEREHRETLWERFGEVTKKMHAKRDAFFTEMRNRAAELVEEKQQLVNKIKEFPLEKVKTHQQWQEAIKGVEAIRQAFVKIGRVHHPDNDKVWDDFREVLRTFNHHKNNFYKEQKKVFQENLNKKRALLERAEALRDSENWKETTNELKRIQAEWKRIGHVPRSESDKIWKKFRAACNHFFNRLTEHNKEADAAFEDNLKAKQALLEELKLCATSGDKKEVIGRLKALIKQWKGIGKVPREAMGIDRTFNQELDQKFKAIDLDRKESQRIRFENRMEVLSGDDQDDMGLRRERSKLYQQKEEAEKELNQLENNMGFFSSSNKNNPLLKEAQKKIDSQRNHIASIEEKIKMLNVKIREVNAAAAAKAEDTDTEEEAKEGD